MTAALWAGVGDQQDTLNIFIALTRVKAGPYFRDELDGYLRENVEASEGSIHAVLDRMPLDDQLTPPTALLYAGRIGDVTAVARAAFSELAEQVGSDEVIWVDPEAIWARVCAWPHHRNGTAA